MCQDAVVTSRVREPPAMSISMMGIDTAKSVFQLHGVDAQGKVQLKRKLRRDELIAFLEQQPRCTVAMEACGAAHHWARVLSGLGYEVKLIASEAVKPFVKRGKKNGPADAAAICAAASRPEAKFVVVKSLEQQGVLALHSVRSLLVKQETMLANAMRGLATEFGFVVPKGMDKLQELVALVEEDKGIPEQARDVFAELREHCRVTTERVEELERQIVVHARHNDTARRLATVPGIGPITASLIAATVGDSIGTFIEPAWVHLDKFTNSAGDSALRTDARFKMAQAGSIRAPDISRPGSGWCRASTRV